MTECRSDELITFRLTKTTLLGIHLIFFKRETVGDFQSLSHFQNLEV